MNLSALSNEIQRRNELIREIKFNVKLTHETLSMNKKILHMLRENLKDEQLLAD